MATVFERLQLYRSSPESIEVSNKLSRRISHNIRSHYDKKGDPTKITYITSIEPSGEFSVRNYPDKYTPTIDYIIRKEIERHLINISLRNVPCEKIPPPTKEAKKRKRIPAKPILQKSFKPSNPNL